MTPTSRQNVLFYGDNLDILRRYVPDAHHEGGNGMKLYAGTTEQFRADARMHRIAKKLLAEYTTQIGHRPAPSEVASWQNSLMALEMLVDQAELNDHGVMDR